MAAISHNEYHEGMDFSPLFPELFTLVMANSNEQIKDLLNLLSTGKLNKNLKEELLKVTEKKVENRLLIKRITEVLDYLGKQ